MKVSAAIEHLMKLDPDDQIIIDYYLKSDFDYITEDDKTTPLTESEWHTVGQRADKVLTWYSDLDDLVRDVIQQRSNYENLAGVSND